MSESYVCTVPALPPSLNTWATMHWAYRRRLKQEFQQQLWAVLSEKGNRCPRDVAFVDCKAVLTFRDKRRRDAENFGAVLWKWAADVIVQEGVIPDDTPEYILCHTPGIIIGEPEGTLIVLELRSLT